MVERLYYSCEEDFKPSRTWKFKFYNVEILKCPKYEERFSYYLDVSPRGRRSKFVIKIKPKVRGGSL